MEECPVTIEWRETIEKFSQSSTAAVIQKLTAVHKTPDVDWAFQVRAKR
jgi:hypothetical protein